MPLWLFGFCFFFVLGPEAAWSLDNAEIRHLFDRTAFGATLDEAAVFASLSREEAVDRVIGAHSPTPMPPSLAGDPPFPRQGSPKILPEAERMALKREYSRRQREQRVALKGWWYRWMLATESPLTERMTLFWHNWFTSALQVVPSPQLMFRQNQLLRRHALGNFGDLMRAAVTDPALLLYLDGGRNRKDQPNENLARELLELFALGEGHYGESDVKAAARALSGWTVDRDSGTARFDPRRHDDGQKTFLGKTGHWGVEAVVAILLRQPRTGELVVERLWRELVSPQPDPSEVRRLAQVFRDGGYEIRPLLRALLLSEAFWASEHRGTLIKSPVELIVGTLRRFDLAAPTDKELVSLGRQMGQDLFDPPNVKGWPGYTAWIDADRLLARERFLQGLTRGLDDEGPGQAWAGLGGPALTALLLPYADALPQAAVGGEGVEAGGEGVGLVGGVLDPRYQLK